MSVRRLAAEQPEAFAFTPENLDWAKDQLKKYPQGREASAVLPLMWRAQEQCGGWLPEPALRAIADMLGMAYIRVYEIATFYTMFNLAPVGRYYVQLCGTTPCWLRGAEALKDTCRKVIGEPGHVTHDGVFSWVEVECLGACVNAPMVQINKDYYEDLTPESFETILVNLREGRKVKPGPQDGRHSSEPFGGATTLIDPKLYADHPAPEADTDDLELALTDSEAKNPGAAASEREAAVPKLPLRDSSGKRRK
jgi:NADH-quinone oxidoreductase subunit E